MIRPPPSPPLSPPPPPPRSFRPPPQRRAAPPPPAGLRPRPARRRVQPHHRPCRQHPRAVRRVGVPAQRHVARIQRRHRDVARVGCGQRRSEEHTSELQSRLHLVCRLLLEKKNIVKSRPSVTT